METIKLNLGCGHVRPAGWINTDGSWNANLQRLPVIRTLVKSMFKTVAYHSHDGVHEPEQKMEIQVKFR